MFSDYAASDDLIPLWKFCDDSSRATAIETAYADWAEKKYNQYIQTVMTPTTGRLRFTLVNFKNINVMDGSHFPVMRNGSGRYVFIQHLTEQPINWSAG